VVVDELYAFLFLNPYHAIAQFTAQPVDQGVINAAGDGLGRGERPGYLVASLPKWLCAFLRAWMLVGLAAILTYLVLR